MFQSTSAQQMPTEKLMTLRLPPIDSLFETARKSSMIEYYGYRMESQELALKTERRAWLTYFNLSASYSYGVMGMNSYVDLGSSYPIVYQTTGGDQIWYNAGVSFRLPLDNVFDRTNRIKIQQLRIKETLKERDLWYDQQKLQIIEFYYKAQQLLKNMEYLVELASFAEANYQMVQKDYLVGATSMQALNTAKSSQMQCLLQLEELKTQLTVCISKLEILSYTKIIK